MLQGVWHRHSWPSYYNAYYIPAHTDPGSWYAEAVTTDSGSPIWLPPKYFSYVNVPVIQQYVCITSCRRDMLVPVQAMGLPEITHTNTMVRICVCRIK